MSALLLVIVLVYAFVASAGRRGAWPTYFTYYDLNSEAFRAGQLHLPVAPAPELLAQANPYDPRHRRWWLWDASLYQGRYYLYWGPFPAVLQALAKSALRIHGIIGDQYLVFAFSAASAVFGGLLLNDVSRRLFRHLPAALLAAAILAFGLANPVLHLVASAGVYQVAIAGGQSCMLGGLWCAFRVVGSEHPRATRRRWLALTGMCWALALACRVSLAPVIGLLALATILAASAPSQGWRRTLGDLLCVGAPLALGAALLLGHNWLRFHDVWEFGTSLQLTTLPFEFSWRYWPANLYSYLLRPFEVSCRFPFLLQVWNMGPSALPKRMASPEGYLITEPVVGWLLAAPSTWLAPAALLEAGRSARALWRGTEQGESARQLRAYVWCAASFAMLGSISGGPAMGLYMATMRYLGDITYGLVLLGLLGGFTLYSSARRQVRRWSVAGLFTLLAGGTIAIGLLLGYQGYNDHFRRFNPRLDRQLTRALSVCPQP